jgi:hypothetical protein
MKKDDIVSSQLKDPINETIIEELEDLKSSIKHVFDDNGRCFGCGEYEEEVNVDGECIYESGDIIREIDKRIRSRRS